MYRNLTLSYVFKTNRKRVKLQFWEIYTIKVFCLFCVFLFTERFLVRSFTILSSILISATQYSYPQHLIRKQTFSCIILWRVTNRQLVETMDTNHWVIYPYLTLTQENGNVLLSRLHFRRVYDVRGPYNNEFFNCLKSLALVGLVPTVPSVMKTETRKGKMQVFSSSRSLNFLLFPFSARHVT